MSVLSLLPPSSLAFGSHSLEPVAIVSILAGGGGAKFIDRVEQGEGEGLGSEV